MKFYKFLMKKFEPAQKWRSFNNWKKKTVEKDLLKRFLR